MSTQPHFKRHDDDDFIDETGTETDPREAGKMSDKTVAASPSGTGTAEPDAEKVSAPIAWYLGLKPEPSDYEREIARLRSRVEELTTDAAMVRERLGKSAVRNIALESRVEELTTERNAGATISAILTEANAAFEAENEQLRGRVEELEAIVKMARDLDRLQSEQLAANATGKLIFMDPIKCAKDMLRAALARSGKVTNG